MKLIVKWGVLSVNTQHSFVWNSLLKWEYKLNRSEREWARGSERDEKKENDWKKCECKGHA